MLGIIFALQVVLRRSKCHFFLKKRRQMHIAKVDAFATNTERTIEPYQKEKEVSLHNNKKN